MNPAYNLVQCLRILYVNVLGLRMMQNLSKVNPWNLAIPLYSQAPIFKFNSYTYHQRGQ